MPGVLVALLLGGWLARDPIRELFSEAVEQTTEQEALHPARVGASSESGEHTAAAAFDGFHNRYWAPDAPGEATGEYLEAEFEEPVEVRTILVTPGSSANQDEFLRQARPASLTVTLLSGAEEVATETLSLKDEPGAQTFSVHGADVDRVRITVDSAFGTGDGRLLALAEVEFFGRR
ncbi:hypothetical protein D7294_10235 [Streptomyces hoynatensis]|uniref:NAD glycohydrolase translocation F5/8 type C domain-containing protein n=1 Tax=Streptomyces hoynatensis TaxID=1141874 RepID=A0A3A9Z797_9ACTN|nr:hypothetical protein D7294_10235 [Streptomyces hoynatensis]